MRTTLTIAPDVAVLIKKAMRIKQRRFKEIVNDALREGLRHLQTPPRAKGSYVTPAVQLGPCLLPSLDDVVDALAASEGETYR